MTLPFDCWLTEFASVLQLADAAELSQQRTLLVNDVICTFVPPCSTDFDVATLLIDAGEISDVHKKQLAELALSRNLENFLLCAPLFFVNPASQHLVIGQKFEFIRLAPAAFVPLVTALVWQAQAWREGAVQ